MQSESARNFAKALLLPIPPSCSTFEGDVGTIELLATSLTLNSCFCNGGTFFTSRPIEFQWKSFLQDEAGMDSGVLKGVCYCSVACYLYTTNELAVF